ncbi:hypothetical protein [Mucilaginibacter glaciei]|uniref:PBCV-specific basic adaptor domain-containing protein n=1 Tax=Mucilaginibacter glaciei TaxID=2772109 RepID=A0A926NK84_9SPHI|nr:hypothetical protein [Mucilaginibacter glaciei]MBD1392766.1 hypothetical protein [Mucilaginibacter glaciei]
MKRLFKSALFAASLFAASSTFAQTHKDSTLGGKISNGAKKGWKATKKTAVKVGNGTAEVASKGAAAVADKKFDGKVAPNGETVYIDKNSAYYYVNGKGKHVYVKKATLVNKPM